VALSCFQAIRSVYFPSKLENTIFYQNLQVICILKYGKKKPLKIPEPVILKLCFYALLGKYVEMQVEIMNTDIYGSVDY
jgi:hypothetical protein